MLVRQELVDRRIQQPDGNRVRGHDLEQLLEIGPLQGQQLVQGRLALLGGIGHDHLDDDRQPLRVVEHALGARQTDSFGAISQGPAGVVRQVGIGPDLQLRHLVRPAQQDAELLGEVRLDRRDLPHVHLTAGTVDGNDVTLAEAGLTHIGLTPVVVDADALGASHTGLAHAAGNHRGVGGLAAAGREYAFGGEKSMDILGLGLLAHQDHLLTQVVTQLLGAVGVEHGNARGGPRRGRQALRHCLGTDIRVEAGKEHLLQELGLNAQQGLALAESAPPAPSPPRCAPWRWRSSCRCGSAGRRADRSRW